MATIALGDMIRASFFCGCQDQVGVNVRHYVVTAAEEPTATDIAVANALKTEFSNPYKNVLPLLASFLGVGVQRVTPTLGPLVYSTGLAVQGTVTGPPLPLQTSAVISFKTGLAGRRNRARAYVPFPPQSAAGVTGLVAPAYEGLLQFLANPMMSVQIQGVGITDWTLQGVANYKALGAPSPITSYQIRLGFGTQRRRSYFGARNLFPLG